MRDRQETVRRHMERHREAMERVGAELGPRILEAARILVGAFRRGGRVLLFGNGGSMADALHIEGELAGRYLLDRAPLPAIALGAGLSSTTAIANDLGYDQVFARQLRGLARAGDAALAISTSGRSRGVLEAVRTAREIGVRTIALTGRDGGDLSPLVDCPLVVPARETPTIQECHITIGHILCRIVEEELFGGSAHGK